MDDKESFENKTQFKEKLDELKRQLSELQESDAKLKQFQDALKDSEKRSWDAEESLNQRIRLEQIINEISINLIDVDTDKLDEAFNMALEMIGVAPSHILHAAFGYKYDLRPASEIGMATCFVNRSGLALPPGYAPDITVTSIADLAQALNT